MELPCKLALSCLYSVIILCGFIGLGVSNLQRIDARRPVCLGSILTLECTVNGRAGEATVWHGSAFDCISSNNEIILLHDIQMNASCNNGTITAQSTRIESNHTGTSLYVSQLKVVITSEMNETRITCVYDDGRVATYVGEYVIKISETALCTGTLANQNETIYINVSCGIPETHNSVHYLNYNSTLEGSMVSFWCTNMPLQDEVFISVCLKNASWIPNPVRQCNDRIFGSDCGPPPPAQNGHIVPYNSTLEGAEVMYVCWNVNQEPEENISQCIEIYTTAICNAKGKWEPNSNDMCSIFSERSIEALSQEGKIAVASSVTMFAATSILFFIVGFLSRHFCYKKRKMAETASSTKQPQIPNYDDVVIEQQKEQELELKENVAYAQPVLSQTNN